MAELAKEVRNKGWIMYGARSPKGDMDLYLIRPDGSDRRNITNTPAQHEGGPRISRDGRKVLYRQIPTTTEIHHNRWGFQGHLVLANADGTDPVVLGKDGEYPWASWSPDGKQICCLTLKGIQIIDLATMKVVRRLDRKGIYQQLFWSPDGEWFCGVSNAYGEKWTVVRMNAKTGQINPVRKFSKRPRPVSGSGARQYLGGAECTPDWFPDSKHILFSHHPGRDSGFRWTQLWMADGDGKRSSLVYAEQGRHIYGGTLSPDGKYVLFMGVLTEEEGEALTSATSMGIMRFRDAPTIVGESRNVRRRHPNTKDGPVLALPVAYEPDWTYADIQPKR